MREGLRVTLQDRPATRQTEPVLRPAGTRATTAIGSAPLILAVDRGTRRTIVRAYRGNDLQGADSYPNPATHHDGMVRLIHAKHHVLGPRRQPKAGAISTSEPLSEGGQTEAATASENPLEMK